MLNNVIFYVVPMINIEGVILGNSRRDSFGLDLNR
jgi:murein tripeptide amidase MpaA